jgi:hypothetical protein
MKGNILGTRGRMLGAAALFAALATSPFMAGSAHANYSICRSDPVVVLSNLATIDLSANIGDDLSDVRSVTYVIHAPIGTRATAIIPTDGLIGLKERTLFYADNARDTYTFTTTVTTGQGGVSVTAESAEVSVLGLVAGAASTTGTSNQTLYTAFHSLL